ncbi:hypothetical protein CL55_00003140 [Polynucleobacter duraquae]|uniref:SxtJ n=1 Tax=Polynucleobacter duraquae TaxID=1835254 RepID=A0A0E3ZL16_9BURK|nr:SxtJ family membrane protein [Polynucleobacter duraquae]AKD24647.1 hypothetical protein CL55_00003140 [Polynucleobacter duraquae]
MLETQNNFKKNRDFGYLFGLISFAFFVFFYQKNAYFLCLLAFFFATTFALAAVLWPQSLTPLSRAWYLLGEILGKIVSPIILALIFYGLLTPIALITKLLGRDELRLKRNLSKVSYWIEREPEILPRDKFKNQF